MGDGLSPLRPHSDSMWPNAPEELGAVLNGVPDDEIDKITHENALRWYRFDPFAHLPRPDSTVGSLRAAAAGHDIAIRSYDKGRHGTRSVDLGRLAEEATA